MSWAIGYDPKWHRDIGYGVPAFCDAPRCKKEIDRGLSYVCGEPFEGDFGCGLYFCGEHLFLHKFRSSDGWGGYCKRCISHKPPYVKISPEHPRWIKWKLTDKSWAQWRKENPNEVIKLLKSL